MVFECWFWRGRWPWRSVSCSQLTTNEFLRLERLPLPSSPSLPARHLPITTAKFLHSSSLPYRFGATCTCRSNTSIALSGQRPKKYVCFRWMRGTTGGKRSRPDDISQAQLVGRLEASGARDDDPPCRSLRFAFCMMIIIVARLEAMTGRE